MKEISKEDQERIEEYTLQDAKDEVAKRYYSLPTETYKSWDDMESTLSLLWTKNNINNLFSRYDEVSDLYASKTKTEGFNEGIEAAIKLNQTIGIRSGTLAHRHIVNELEKLKKLN